MLLSGVRERRHGHWELPPSAPPAMSLPFAAPRVLALASVALLAGCVSRLDHRHVEGEFGGVAGSCARAWERGGTVRLLTVHGVGDPGPLYSDGLARGLAKRLGLVRRPAEESQWSIEPDGLIPSTELGGDGRLGSLRVSVFEAPDAAAHRLEIWELDWSPATALPRRRYLAEDDVERADRPRVFLNRLLKKDLVNGRLSDALLYAGPYREVMHRPLRLLLQELFTRDVADRDELVFVAESLGSSILLDVLSEFTAEPSFGRPRSVEAVVAPRAVNVYFFANQLPLLRMADTARAPDLPPAPPRPPPLPARLHLEVAAVTDPNDLLSYTISEELAQELASLGGLSVRFVNVTVNIAEGAILGVLANPVTAHAGHAANPFVMDLVAFGTAAPGVSTAGLDLP